MMDESSKLCDPGTSDYHHRNCNVTRFTKVCDKTDTLLLLSIRASNQASTR